MLGFPAIETKRKKTFSLAQRAYLNSLFEAGIRSASKSQRPPLEKAAADTGLLTVITNTCKSVSFCHINV